MSYTMTVLPRAVERQRRTIWRMFERGRLSADAATVRLLRLTFDARRSGQPAPAADPMVARGGSGLT
jgi:hypothetical protein